MSIQSSYDIFTVLPCGSQLLTHWLRTLASVMKQWLRWGTIRKVQVLVCKHSKQVPVFTFYFSQRRKQRFRQSLRGKINRFTDQEKTNELFISAFVVFGLKIIKSQINLVAKLRLLTRGRHCLLWTIGARHSEIFSN